MSSFSCVKNRNVAGLLFCMHIHMYTAFVSYFIKYIKMQYQTITSRENCFEVENKLWLEGAGVKSLIVCIVWH